MILNSHSSGTVHISWTWQARWWLMQDIVVSRRGFSSLQETLEHCSVFEPGELQFIKSVSCMNNSSNNKLSRTFLWNITNVVFVRMSSVVTKPSISESCLQQKNCQAAILRKYFKQETCSEDWSSLFQTQFSKISWSWAAPILIILEDVITTDYIIKSLKTIIKVVIFVLNEIYFIIVI